MKEKDEKIEKKGLELVVKSDEKMLFKILCLGNPNCNLFDFFSKIFFQELPETAKKFINKNAIKDKFRVAFLF